MPKLSIVHPRKQLAAVATLWALTSCVTPAAPPETVRLLSYNIHMWQIAVDDLAGIIRNADADVVGLNEAWDKKRNDELASKLGYHVVYGGQDPEVDLPRKAHTVNGFYMPQVLLTKHRIVEAKVFNAMAAKEHDCFDPEVPIYRGGILAVLETASGNRFVVFVLHLHPWGGGDNERMTTMRRDELEGILKKLQAYRDLPIIILGDFNTRSHFDIEGGWKVTRHLGDNGYADLYRTLKPDAKAAPGLTCGEGRIDYIFHNTLVTPVDSEVVREPVFGSRGYQQSDHLALFGVVKLANGFANQNHGP